MEPTITVTPRGEERIHNGHFWVYRGDVAGGSAEPGAVVRVASPNGRFLARAFYSDRSQITLRILTRHDVPVDRGFWRSRLEQAITFRDTLDIDASAYRLVHGEGDLIPSLVIDRYGDYIALQALSQGTDRLTSELTGLLMEIVSPKGIIARNDPRVRLLEGLEQAVTVLHGEIPEKVAVREGKVEYDVDLRHGQKTGAFLDQRENRQAAAQYASGRTLDCFSYAGGFALQLAPHVDELTALDISEDATALLARNAARNGLSNVQVRTTNVFDELADARADERSVRLHRARPAGVCEKQSRNSEGVVGVQGNQPSRAEAPEAGRVSHYVQLLLSRQRGCVRRSNP